jgi:N-acetyl sugar amidotransferase
MTDSLASFKKETGPFDVKYGLPADVRFCRACVISNQRPNSAIEFKHTIESKKETIHFDDEGVCDACRFSEKKAAAIDWNERERQLKEICDQHRRSDGGYDCLVPGSGGKDSFYAAHVLKYKYGMNPLTITWAPHMYTDWGWKNFEAWIHAGFDNVNVTPNGRIHRLLTRLAVDKLFHPFQPFILGQKGLAPKMALKFNIPLIFYGENEAEYGNPIGATASALQDWRYYTAEDQKNIFLAGTSVYDLKTDYGLTENDLWWYLPADVDQVQKAQVQVHFLGYYLKWHPQNNYYYAVEHGGFIASPERTAGTYSKYNSIDDKVDDLHYYTTLVKFGIGRATYDASQEIRSGDITREEGVALVKRFDLEFPDRFMPELMEYLSIRPEHFPAASKMFERPVMDKAYFLDLADQFRSPHLWKLTNEGWELRHKVWEDESSPRRDQADEAMAWKGNRY